MDEETKQLVVALLDALDGVTLDDEDWDRLQPFRRALRQHTDITATSPGCTGRCTDLEAELRRKA